MQIKLFSLILVIVSSPVMYAQIDFDDFDNIGPTKEIRIKEHTADTQELVKLYNSFEEQTEKCRAQENEKAEKERKKMTGDKKGSDPININSGPDSTKSNDKDSKQKFLMDKLELMYSVQNEYLKILTTCICKKANESKSIFERFKAIAKKYPKWENSNLVITTKNQHLEELEDIEIPIRIKKTQEIIDSCGK